LNACCLRKMRWLVDLIHEGIHIYELGIWIRYSQVVILLRLLIGMRNLLSVGYYWRNFSSIWKNSLILLLIIYFFCIFGWYIRFISKTEAASFRRCCILVLVSYLILYWLFPVSHFTSSATKAICPTSNTIRRLFNILLIISFCLNWIISLSLIYSFSGTFFWFFYCLRYIIVCILFLSYPIQFIFIWSGTTSSFYK